MRVEPIDQPGDYRTGSLPSNYSVKDITRTLGFPPNVDDDPNKVKHAWGILVDGIFCAIWDYKGARWSTYDPQDMLRYLFPDSEVDGY